MAYRNCRIFKLREHNLFAWEEISFGIESDDAFETIESAKADIDRYFLPGPAVIDACDGELSRAA